MTVRGVPSGLFFPAPRASIVRTRESERDE